MYNQLRLCVLNNFTQLLIKIKSLLGDHLCLFVLTVSRCRLLSPLSIVQKNPELYFSVSAYIITHSGQY